MGKITSEKFIQMANQKAAELFDKTVEEIDAAFQPYIENSTVESYDYTFSPGVYLQINFVFANESTTSVSLGNMPKSPKEKKKKS